MQKALNANIHQTVVDLIDSSRLQLDPNAKLIQEWTLYSNGSWWLIGQVNEYRQPHGVARMIETDGWWIKEGSFVNGKLTGFGRHIGWNYYYIGEFKDGKYHGQGTYINSNGTYKGAFVNSDFHGHGTFTTNQGNVHAGVWNKDKLNGVYFNNLK